MSFPIMLLNKDADEVEDNTVEMRRKNGREEESLHLFQTAAWNKSVIDADIINSILRLMKDKQLLLVIDADIIGSLLRLMKDNNLQLLVLSFLKEILISSSEEDVLRVACWALSYISEDRDDIQAILDAGVCHNLVKLLWYSSNSVLYPALRTISNIFAGFYGCFQSVNNTINADSVISLRRLMLNTQLLEERVLPFLKAKLISSTDEDVLRVACWALSCISRDTDYIDAILDDDVGHRLVELLGHSSNSVLYPALRTVSNIFFGEIDQIQFMIDKEALPCLLNILTRNSCWYISLEACYAISNITCSFPYERHIKPLIDTGIIARLIRLLENAETDVRIRIEAANVIGDVIYGEPDDYIGGSYLLAEECIKAMCNSLSCPNQVLVVTCLLGLENLLRYGNKQTLRFDSVNAYAHVIDGFMGFEKIRKLKDIGGDENSEIAMRILETYHPDSANLLK